MSGMTFQVNARHNGLSSWFEKGDAVSIEFPDGKGVSARLADVLIAPGGSPFFLVCNETGEWPDLSPLRDMIAMVQSHGYVVQEAEDYAAGLRIEYERGVKEAKMGMLQSGYTAAQGKRIGVEEGANKIEFHDDGGASMTGTFRTHTTSPQLHGGPLDTDAQSIQDEASGIRKGTAAAALIDSLRRRLGAAESRLAEVTAQHTRQAETITRQQDVERVLRRQLSASHTVITRYGEQLREKEELETSLRNDLGQLRNEKERLLLRVDNQAERLRMQRADLAHLEAQRAQGFRENGPLSQAFGPGRVVSVPPLDVVNAQELHITVADGATLTVNLSR